jgi:hypothetical protein
VKPRTLLILLALVVALGAFVWFVERDLPSSEERGEQAKKVLALEAGDVEALTLEAEGRKVRLEREPAAPAANGKGGEGEGDGASPAASGGTWRLVEPIAAAADGREVRRFLDTLADLAKQRTLTEFDPAELGLAAPRGRVTLRTGKGETVLAVGRQLPSSDSTVVTVAGRKEAYLVAGAFWSDLAREAGDWRDKQVFRGERGDVQSVKVMPAGGEAVLLARRGDAFWLESPLSDRADREGTDRLLSQLAGLSASRFVDEAKAPAELGLAPPAAVVEVVLRDRAEPFRIEIGAPVSEGSTARYARSGGQVFTTETDLGGSIGKAPSDWRSRRWSGFESWEVDSLQVQDAEGTVALVRAGGEWKRDGVEIPYTPVSDLLVAITGAEADSIAEGPADTPAGPALFTMTLKGAEGREEALTLYPILAAVEGALHPARASDREAVLLFPQATRESLAKAVADVRAAQPVPEEKPKEGGGGAAADDDIEIEAEEGSEEPPPP